MTNKAETLLKTDKAIYYYVWEKMMEQGAKSLDLYYDEDDNESLGDNNRYFGWQSTDMDARCALGFIMNAGIADEIEVEDKQADDEDVISCIMLSNPEWKMTGRSIEMVILLQYIHDRMEVGMWNNAFKTYSVYFDKDGNFDINKLKDISTNMSGLKDAVPLVNDRQTTELHIEDKTYEYNGLNSCAILEFVQEQAEKAKAAAGISLLAEQVIFNKPSMLSKKTKENA